MDTTKKSEHWKKPLRTLIGDISSNNSLSTWFDGFNDFIDHRRLPLLLPPSVVFTTLSIVGMFVVRNS